MFEAAVKKYHRWTRVGIEPNLLITRQNTSRPLRLPNGQNLVLIPQYQRGTAWFCLSNEVHQNEIVDYVTVKPRLEVHMDMILFEVILKNIHLIPQDQIVQWRYL